MNQDAAKSNQDVSELIGQVVVTAELMQQIEGAMFAAGMPVAALMEKVAGRITQWIVEHFPRDRTPTIGILVGPGHNGGDALVVARELHHHGYRVIPWCPFDSLKDLTANHKRYLAYLGIAFADKSFELQGADLIVDGCFGFGLTRPIEGDMAKAIDNINKWQTPIVSIDLPSGIDTDTGAVLGTAIQADHTLCLGLWKLGLLQDAALKFVGKAHLIPFNIPAPTIHDARRRSPPCSRIIPAVALAHLPRQRSLTAHKYTAGTLLLIAGSRQYAGAALLAGQGAIASGVGMVTLVVPESLRLMLVSQLPEALVLGAPETESGAIAELPPALAWAKYDVVACGPGLTLQADAVMAQAFHSDRPLVLDADGLNWLAHQSAMEQLQQRSTPTLLTPHPGEFSRLFPDLLEAASTPSAAAQQAAQAAHCTLILKGAISAIAHADGQLWFNPESTPALARGGSGDVLTGLLSGLAAQWLKRDRSANEALLAAAIGGVWWHAQTARAIAAQRTVLGCSPSQLAAMLPEVLSKLA